IGSVGEIEVVPENRIEMILPRRKRRAVVEALIAAHSYEEPAYDIYELAQQPSERGGGRIGVLAEPLPLADFARLVAESLPRTEHGVRVSGDPDRMIETVAVVGERAIRSSTAF